ncbi:dethiobiotin synthase [Colwellia sp. MEBiC06753]
MTKRYFITATDTDAGKTLVATAIIYKLAANQKVAAYKPVSAGCDRVNNELVNEDAAQLLSVSNAGQTLVQVNPIAFEQPIAPHIAAEINHQAINLAQLTESYQQNLALLPEVILTEGAGGWRLPLGKGLFLSDFAKETQQQVILVVNMKLGCLNHALLTYEAIIADGLTCVGWVANCFEEMAFRQENIEQLKTLLPVTCLGVVPKVNCYQQAAEYLDISSL